MIPVNRPIITKDDSINILNAVKSGWVSSAGPQIKSFEKKFKSFINKNLLLLCQVELLPWRFH